MSWLLCDYGEVLSRPQRPEVVEALAALAGMDREAFEVAYWAHRAAYDRADLDAEAYWTATLGRPPGDRLGALVDADVAGWLVPNEATLAATRRAADRGLRLAILSNAPLEVARAVDARPWLAGFSPRLFSCGLRAVKPEPGAYAAALTRLGARPEEVTFLDDRPANVAGAREAGIAAELFVDAAQIDRLG